MNVFIVYGTTGEYADRRVWPVRAFDNGSEAELFMKVCQANADAIWQKASHGCDEMDQAFSANRIVEESPNKLDPEIKFDYTGTYYLVTGPIPFGNQD